MVVSEVRGKLVVWSTRSLAESEMAMAMSNRDRVWGSTYDENIFCTYNSDVFRFL